MATGLLARPRIAGVLSEIGHTQRHADFGDLFNRRASKRDTTRAEYRLKIIVSEQIPPSPDPTPQ